MKKTILGLLLLSSFSTFAMNLNDARKCPEPKADKVVTFNDAVDVIKNVTYFSFDSKKMLIETRKLAKKAKNCDELTNLTFDYMVNIAQKVIDLEDVLKLKE